MAALEHLIADLPSARSVKLGQIVSLFDLPDHGPWLLDTLTDGDASDTMQAHGMDAALLVRLEDTLSQADIGPFLRWCPVMNIERPEPRLAWEERTLSWAALAACLCPGRDPQDGGWLSRRLASCLDRRVLAALTGPRELSGNRAFPITLSVGSLVSSSFLAFDSALPAGLRGRVVLRLDAADILADAASFRFGRNFAQARAYRLLVRDTAPGLLDHRALAVEYVECRLSDAMRARPETLPPSATLVLDGVDDAEALAWARAQGCVLVKGLTADENA